MNQMSKTTLLNFESGVITREVLEQKQDLLVDRVVEIVEELFSECTDTMVQSITELSRTIIEEIYETYVEEDIIRE